jgi:hypothetical protein
MLIKKMMILLLVGLVSSLQMGCSSSGDSKVSKAVDEDAVYFEAAKQYLTYSDVFGPQTDLTSHAILKKIEFSSNMAPIRASPDRFLAQVLTVRKKFVVNAENNLMILKRDQPSRKDSTTMTVGMRSGNNRTHIWDAITQSWDWNQGRHRANVVNQCDRIVFNAKGEGVCLVKNGSSITMTKLSQKYGHRIISACAQRDQNAYCTPHGQFSGKNLNLVTNDLTLGDIK